jgi:hypothetical protein
VGGEARERARAFVRACVLARARVRARARGDLGTIRVVVELERGDLV